MRPGQSRARAEAILELLPSLGQGWGGNFGKEGRLRMGGNFVKEGRLRMGAEKLSGGEAED